MKKISESEQEIMMAIWNAENKILLQHPILRRYLEKKKAGKRRPF